MKKEPSNISSRIRNIRIGKGLKQEYVAHQMKMTQANYSKIELGKIEPSVHQIEKFAEISGTTTDEIINGIKEVKIEHNNHPNSNNQSTNNGVAYYQKDGFENERKALHETIETQKITIQSQQKTIEMLYKRLGDLEKE